MAKQNNQAHVHLQWLVDSRAANQKSALTLLRILDNNIEKIRKNKEHSTRAQLLVAVCFSLWRAAFLADKTGVRETVLQHAQDFLGKMLADNAITYPQDRASKEWTFNYYMNNAKDSLLLLSKQWPNIKDILSAYKKVSKNSTLSRRRWDRHQLAFECAVTSFKNDLDG